MYKGKKVAVVVPAHNEELLIGRVIETMPEFVDKIVVVDDYSTDQTAQKVASYQEKVGDKLVLIRHQKNRGVGGAISTGYKWARENEMDATAVMAGDAQMDPKELPSLLDPVVEEGVDYTKGNRLFTGDAWKIIPKRRYLGNAVLSLLTKIASGYWHIADSQSGYTVISLRALKLLNLDRIYRRYGMPNHFLVMLNIYNCRVRDVMVTPIYNIGEKSGFEPLFMIPKLSMLMIKIFLWRLKEKYIIRDFHPLVFFYFLAFVLLVASFFLNIRMFYIWITTGNIPPINALAVMFCSITGLQSAFFAMWFDIENNKNLR